VRLRTLSLGLLAAALGGAARAADLSDFQSLCVATHADSKAALAAADAAGWMALPDALLAQLRRPGMETAEGRLKSDNGGMRFMMAAHDAALSNIPGAKIDACAVGLVPGDAGLADQIKAWAAVPEMAAMSKNGMHVYAFTEEGGRHGPVDMTGPDPMATWKARHGALVVIQDQPQLTLLIYGVPSPTSPN